MTEAAVRFEEVHLVFNGGLRAPVWALRGLSLEVEHGAVFGLLGPNGAGKTTSISCLLGLLEPQAGAISVWGRRVRPSRALCCTGTSALLEDTRLPPFLAVRSALEVVCALRGIRSRRQEIDRVVALCAIEPLLARTVSVLSKGQARRVGLAAALIGDPALLVLDEPSAGLDAHARVEFEALVASLRDGHRTMIIASHLLGDVEATCTHLAVVNDGRVVLSGPSQALLREARTGRTSEIHVDAAHSAKLDELAVAHSTSRYPGLLMLDSELHEEELFALLAASRIVPRRVEPKVTVTSLYLDAIGHRAGEPS
jgi:ABC-2 type transport system ATP-binding protein